MRRHCSWASSLYWFGPVRSLSLTNGTWKMIASRKYSGMFYSSCCPEACVAIWKLLVPFFWHTTHLRQTRARNFFRYLRPVMIVQKNCLCYTYFYIINSFISFRFIYPKAFLRDALQAYDIFIKGFKKEKTKFIRKVCLVIFNDWAFQNFLDTIWFYLIFLSWELASLKCVWC